LGDKNKETLGNFDSTARFTQITAL